MPRKKVTVQTDNSEWKAPKKRRKPRKPMTEEQKVAAAERLAKAREKKAAADPNYGKTNIHESLRDLPDDHQLHPKKVKEWIKTQKDLASAERKNVKAGVKGAEARKSYAESYVRSMKSYLRSGDWSDMFYGEYADKKIRNRCVALGYYWYGPFKGEPKRDVGTFYPDLNLIWTQEMDNERKGIEINDERPKRQRAPRKRSKRAVGKRTSKTT